MPKSYYIAAALCLVFLTIIGFALPNAVMQSLQQASIETLSPAWQSLGWVKEKSSTVKESLNNIKQLEENIAQLRMENSLLTAKASQLQTLQEENTRLQEALGFKKQTPFKLLAARVIERDLSNWWSSIIIDRGWADDESLAQDQPVVTPRGVVGKTGVVGRHTTRVILLIDENCRISCEVENSRARGIVTGTSLGNHLSKLCHITFVSRETELPIGARVFTSGLGGSFPQGLLIGTVKEAPPLAANRNFGLFRDGTIDPVVDLDDLRELFVIVGTK